MTIQILFTQFSQLTTTLESIAHIRSLILSAATSGALGQNDINDEPASELLARISSNFEDLVQKRIIRKPKRTEPLSDKVELELIPENWIWTRLGDVVDYGSSPKVDPGEIQESDWLLDLEDIEKSTSRLIRKKQFSEKPFKSTKTSFHAGDVLYGKLRPYLDKVIVANVRGYCTTEIIPIRTYGFIEPNYLRIALKRPSFIEYANRKSYGMNLPRLGTEDARNSLFPLPPLAEQKRIVAKVDELMALCDQLEAQQQERDKQHAALARASLARFANDPTPDNLQFLFHKSYDIDPEDLRKTILRLAVQGKLVPQNESINAPIINDGSLSDSRFDIPNNWTWAQIDDLQPEFQNGASSRGDKDGEPVVVLRLADIKNRNIALDAPREIAISPNQIDKYGLQLGDILITRVNGSADIVGSFIPVQEDISAIYCDHFIRMRIDKELMEPGYMTLAGESQLVRDQIRSLFITTAGQKTVNQGHIRSLQITVPPLTEQKRIVAKVDELMALVDELETQLASSREVAKNLLEALVAELTAA